MAANSTELFEGNLHLAERIANRFMRFRKNGVEYDDLYQEALIGLDKAVKIFDSNKSENFERFAVNVMYQRAMRWMMYKTESLHTPKHIIEIAVTINKRKMRESAPEIIAKELNAPIQYVVRSLEYLQRQFPKSIYEPVVGLDGSSIEKSFLIDSLHDKNDDPYNPVKLDMGIFMNRLKPRQQKILELRMEGLSQDEIAPYVGISQMQISREIKKIKGEYIEFTKIS